MIDYPEAKVYLPQEGEASAAQLQASVAVQYPSFTSYANDFKPLCEVICPKPPFAEPTLKEWDAKEQELADSAAKSDSQNIQIVSAFNRISAEAEAVEWVNQIQRCLDGINRGNLRSQFPDNVTGSSHGNCHLKA
jgi:hypothetical protein